MTDAQFLRYAAHRLGVSVPEVRWSSSRAKWPDIWIDGSTVTVTREWALQSTSERRKRLTHELLHLRGLLHGRVGKWLYSTFPSEDSYSRVVYRSLVNA